MAKTSALGRVLEPEVMDDATEARDYDEMDHGEVNARFVDDLVQVSRDLSRTLDVGTGTAQIPIALCARARQARVLGVDLAEHMLVLGRRNVERAGLGGCIRLERVDAKQMRFGAATFSCVMSNSIVHHVPEPARALAEMRRVLAPGGTLFVRDLARPADDAGVRETVERYARDANPRQRALFDASLRAALTEVEIAEIASGLGFRSVDVRMTSDRHWTLVAS